MCALVYSKGRLEDPMNNRDMEQPDQADGTNLDVSPKKPYQKPGFRHERVFETLALNCGKTGTEGQCSHNKKVS
jgi:hypothetical protein